eukprot:SAG31_NODE_5331_length_2604_cov_1.514571_2_plen_92_part_00
MVQPLKGYWTTFFLWESVSSQRPIVPQKTSTATGSRYLHAFSVQESVQGASLHRKVLDSLQEADFQQFLQTLRSSCTMIPIGGNIDYRQGH